MLVTIARSGEGKCVWCRSDAEGVQAAFNDGLQGFFCKKDFWQALKARAESEVTHAPQSEPSRKPA